MSDFDFKRTTPMPIKAEAVKKILRRDIDPALTDKEMIVYTSRLLNYRKGLRKKLGEREQKVKEILDREGLHPITVNEWLRYCLVPEEMMKNVQGYTHGLGLSQRRVMQLNDARVKKKKAELGLMILELGRQAIEDIERLKYG